MSAEPSQGGPGPAATSRSVPPDREPTRAAASRAARGTPAAAPDAPSGGAESWGAEHPAPPNLLEAMAIARAAAAELTGLKVDGVASSAARPDGGWRVVVEVVESRARMGENDLLGAYALELGPDGGLSGFDRLRRYRRETPEAGA
jgi:hypothetical protein